MNGNRVIILLAGLGGALALYLLARTKRGEIVAADAVGEIVVTAQRAAETVAKWLARGLRNNNPGNIREAKGDATAWQGERATNDDAAFEEFTDMRYGVRAALVAFRNYQSRYGLNTTRQMISRWAPPSENNTGAYIAAVTARVQTHPDTSLDLSDTETALNFLRAVFRQENGPEAELLPDSLIREGIALA